MSVSCPLVETHVPRLLEKIQVSSLVKLYRRLTRADVSSEFGKLTEVGLYLCDDCDLRFFRPSISGSEQFYRTLRQFDWYYLSDKAEFEYASRYIRPTDSVLEIGSGRGAFAKHIPTAAYLGLEFSAAAIEEAKLAGVRVVKETIENHATKCPVSYDVVCAFQVLEHVTDVRSFIEAAIGALKPGGRLILSVPNADAFVASTYNNVMNMPPHHLSFWSRRSLSRVAEMFSLELMELQEERLDPIHYQWYASTVVFHGIQKLLGRKTRVVDRSWSGRLLNSLSFRLGKIYALGLQDQRLRPCGMSITAIYSKKSHS